MIVPASDLVLPLPPRRRIRTVGTGVKGPVGPTGPTGPVGARLTGPAASPFSGVSLGPPLASGATGCVLFPLPTGPVGPTGPQGSLLGGPVGATGPTGFTGFDLGVSRPSEARLEARYSGPPSEVLRLVLLALRRHGHLWQVTGRSAVCDRCLSSVHVDPSRVGSSFRQTGRVRKVLPPAEGPGLGVPGPLPGPVLVRARRLRSSRFPRPSQLREVASRYPSCEQARRRLVDLVHDM